MSSSSGLVSASPVFSDACHARAFGVKLDEPLQEPAPVVNPRGVQALEAQLAMAQTVARQSTEDAIQARAEARFDRRETQIAWIVAGVLGALAIYGWVKWWVK